ncbi:iron-containing redox enzyme family protein [Speluncibacter jeojiensis]|uniref:Iron-containing redox enzyme family protein n=1 Tax=Speluncibacter jeojiensis TaxID=2710754 RepID=A0A9X4RGA9_9ACTN|nr:iron-containing redox enzyme family protein [Corynebacteriales bacterium D3-21]
MDPACTNAEPALPTSRGPLSEAVIAALAATPGTEGAVAAGAVGTDPLGADHQLALLLCYELHYMSFHGVDPQWEWEPELLRLRGRLERSLLAELRDRVRNSADDAMTALDAIDTAPAGGRGIGDHLLGGGTWEQACEYFVHRSIYQLKESDPYAWLIPRLRGDVKAALAAVEFDEFGAGRGVRVHAHLFERLLDAAGLDPTYFAYLDAVPSSTLLVANVATLFGLHRSLRGAAVGHFAVTELTTGPGARKLERALDRLGAPEACIEFYTEHVEADAVHEQVLRHDVVAPLLAAEPELDADVAFGVAVTGFVEDAMAEDILACWDADRSSLLRPL